MDSIPDFQALMLPFLRLLGDGKHHSLNELVNQLSDEFKLTPEDREMLLPSGTQAVIRNRIGWARTYLKKAGLLEAPQRAVFSITENGKKVLQSNPKKIDVQYLKKMPVFRQWVETYKNESENNEEKFASIPTEEFRETTVPPFELMDNGFQQLNETLSFEIFEKLKAITDKQFEKVVLKVLTSIGYGDFREDAAEHTGKSNDGGIDGLIKEDKLGLDVIYIQVKQYRETTVPITSIRDFAGSLLSKKAKKGVFITLSSFPKSAYDFVNNIEHKIVLINGKDLAKLMIEYNVGVSVKTTFTVKDVDSDFFDEI